MRKWIRIITVLIAAVLVLSVCPGTAEEESAVAPVTPSAEGTSSETPAPAYANLVYGAKGENVKQLQLRLRDLGYLTGEADGIFGHDTRRAVMAFQRRNGLDADGQAGPKTQALLYSDEALPVPEMQEINTLSGNLPLLVNKEHPMDEYMIPVGLVFLEDKLDSSLVKIKYAGTMAVGEAVDALERMLTDARKDGITKWQISSAYRSWQDQDKMLTNKITTLRKQNKGWSQSKARNAALRTVAEAGCSEHQTGLAIDINVPGASTFKGTKQCKWLHAHCWEYGFIVRYPENKEKITGFAAEAWHIRYVGVAHATRIHELNMCLEEYLDAIEAGTIIPPGAEENIPELIIPDDEAEEGEGAA